MGGIRKERVGLKTPVSPVKKVRKDRADRRRGLSELEWTSIPEPSAVTSNRESSGA